MPYVWFSLPMCPMTPLELFKCLADDTRLRCVRLIAEHGELCVCELTCALAVIQPKISRHLAQLRACGVLADQRRGQWVYYRLHPDLPAWARRILEATVEAAAAAGDNRRLAAMADRPGERCCA